MLDALIRNKNIEVALRENLQKPVTLLVKLL